MQGERKLMTVRHWLDFPVSCAHHFQLKREGVRWAPSSLLRLEKQLNFLGFRRGRLLRKMCPVVQASFGPLCV